MKKTIFLYVFFFHLTLIFSQNNALNFDGTDDYITVPSSLNNEFSADQITVELWVYLENAGGECMLVGESFLGDGKITFMIWRPLGAPVTGWKAGWFENGFHGVDFSLSLNQWVHIAATYDQSEIKVYLDGALISTVNDTGGLPNGTEEWRIGRRWDLPGMFLGDMDEIRIWNYSQSQSEIQANMNNELAGSESGLVAYYNFNQGTPSGNNSGVTTLNDLTGSYSGTLHNFALTGSTSNWVTSNAPLPVELLSFQARPSHQSIWLTWQTATEINNQSFIIQKSPDGRAWQQIGQVEGQGTTLIQQDYEFIDQRPFQGMNYYRLKQMDFDGGFEYSSIEAVEWMEDLPGLWRVRPNPSSDLLCFFQQEESPADIQVFDMAGRKVLGIIATEGEEHCVDVTQWPSGTYLVKSNTSTNPRQQLFIKN